MKVPWEDKLPCAALALLVLAVFYGIYFAKMLAQKRRGIQTRQIGRRREKDIHTVEVLMSMATLGAPIAQLLSIAFGWSHLPANARFTGFCIGMLGRFSPGQFPPDAAPWFLYCMPRRKFPGSAH